MVGSVSNPRRVEARHSHLHYRLQKAEQSPAATVPMSKRVLIIDDEENIRRMVRLTLEAAGYEAEEARDGTQGLALYADGSRWDAVLLDQRMPGLDGVEILKRIKQRRPDARVILVTAYASIELAVQAMKLGATDFVRKPMTPQILRSSLAAALSKSPDRNLPPAKDEDSGEHSIQTITLNGFEIRRPDEMEAIVPTQFGEHSFVVKDPEGNAHHVKVSIDEEVVQYVERMTRRSLPPDSSFWSLRAERLLSDYLWFTGSLPPEGKLKLKEIDRDGLLMAERWQASESQR